jgi:type I restriction enzyme S subunit
MTLFHLLRDAPDVWAPYEAEGTVFGSINKQQLAGLLVGTIDAVQAETLEAQLQGLEARVGAALVESERLTAARDVLLPQLLSGKLKVKDAESFVEGVV